MKKIFLLFAILYIAFVSNQISANNISAFFYYATFNSPEQGPYVETYITIVGNTAVFKKNENEKFQASLEITMLFKHVTDIKYFKKYNLNSPEIDDTTGQKPNFIDQQRISIPNGIYNFQLIISDNNSDRETFKHNDIITINYHAEDIIFSGVELVESYKQATGQNILTKSGYDLIPYVSDFYPENINKLIFYAEIYNTNKVIEKNGTFLIRYFIESFQTNKILDGYYRFQKQSANQVNVVFGEFSINNLPSGNYNLVIEVRNSKNELLKSKKKFFQRSNPQANLKSDDISTINIEETFVNKITNIDTLQEYIKCLRPIADNIERMFIDNRLSSKKMQYMQNFFYSFWTKRNSSEPEQEWKNYFEQVIFVNKWYHTQIKKGYETDRGRVYLQYGTPNSISESKHEPSAYPYEIWHYYKIEDQTNKKFIFYNPDIAGNDYILLHSDAKGEIINRNWQMMLHGRDTPIYNFDQKQGIDHYGGRADDNFKIPK